MRLMERCGLMNEPPGTVYMEFNGDTDGSLLVKHDTIVHNGSNIDWFYCMMGLDESGLDTKHSPQHSDAIFELDRGGSVDAQIHVLRDGCFDYDQMYAVFSDEDKAVMIEMLLSEGVE